MKTDHSVAGFFHTELGVRVLSAVVMLVFFLGVTWIGNWPFMVVCIALSCLLFFEWQSIVQVTEFDGTEALLTIGFAVLILSPVFGLLSYAIIGFVVLGFILELTSSGEEKSDVRWIGLGALYCAIPALCLPFIRDAGGLTLILFLFVTVWVTDIAAYFVGRNFGGPKLMPKISPKKTWSGAIGGVFLAVLAALVFAGFLESLGVWVVVVLAVLLSITSQIGDLFESWVKRMFDVKDSGNLIPGHGGFLDRVDGLVAATIPVAVMVALSIGGS